MNTYLKTGNRFSGVCVYNFNITYLAVIKLFYVSACAGAIAGAGAGAGEGTLPVPVPVPAPVPVPVPVRVPHSLKTL